MIVLVLLSGTCTDLYVQNHFDVDYTRVNYVEVLCVYVVKGFYLRSSRNTRTELKLTVWA